LVFSGSPIESTTLPITLILRQYKVSYQFSINSTYMINFFLIFFKTKLLMINLKMEHCGTFYAPSYHICWEFKQNIKDIELFNLFFIKINLRFCVDIYFVSWCMYWIIVYFWFFWHNLYKRQNFSNATTCRCNLCKLDSLNIFFVNIQSFEFNQLFIFKFHNSMELFRLHLFIKKPLYTHWY